jgi:signal transduction histidine kinase
LENYRNKNHWIILLFAVVTGIGSLVYTRYLVGILKEGEKEKIEIWAEATRMISFTDASQDISFLSSIIENNKSIPVILADQDNNIISSGNFDEIKMRDTLYLKRQLEEIIKIRDPIVINLGDGSSQYIYYKDSLILIQLTRYPYVQLGIIVLFLVVAYLAFSASKKAEQNQVWVGMSKETAHQLGTPTSSLAGWVEMMHDKYPDIEITKEIARDVERLEKITGRFSGIGSKPVMNSRDIIDIVARAIEYLKMRSSSRIVFQADFDASGAIEIPVNETLLEWVIENVSKNAIDAMEGEGILRYRLMETERNVYLDISDTGRGIPEGAFKKIFNPGFSTKQRGWGLGLSLAKRIIEEFHDGHIFVRNSELGKGSCIRIVLNKR